MSRVALGVLVLLCLALVPLAANAQQRMPSSYTFIAEWDVARDQWPEVSAWMEKSARPVYERLVSDGTLTDYGISETIVHLENGATHSVWFSATSFAGIEKARLEVLKIPPAPALAAAKHRDLYLTGIFGKHRAVSGAGYLRINMPLIQPGKAAQYNEVFEKYDIPIFDELVANGTMSAYALQREFVATMDSNTRFVVMLTPNAESVDKIYAAFAAASQKISAEERAAETKAWAEVTVSGANRQFIARTIAYSIK